MDNFWTGLKCSRKTLAEERSKEISGGYYQLTMFWSGTVVEGRCGGGGGNVLLPAVFIICWSPGEEREPIPTLREAIPNKKSCFYGHFPYPP